MQPRAEPAPHTTALLTIHGESGAWGIPSSAVASVEQPDAAAADEPVELLTLLGIAEPLDPQRQARVLVLQVQGERLHLRVHGTLQLAQSSATQLLPLPDALTKSSPLISHLAVVDGKPALFVVSPERLLQAARGASLALPTRDFVRGSSC